MGVQGEFSGVPMHVGHYCNAMNQQINACNPGAAPFFHASHWRVFIQSALALRMSGLPPETRGPCCSLNHVGGDGTGIGIPLANLGNMIPVWVPPDGTRNPLLKWGRMDRCAVGSVDTEGSSSETAAAREYLKLMTSAATGKQKRKMARRDFHVHQKVFPKPIAMALEAWLILSEEETHWDSVRCILLACSRQDSLFGIATSDMVPKLFFAITCVEQHIQSDDFLDCLSALEQQGMGPDIVKLLRTQMNSDPKVPGFRAFLELLRFIG